MKPIRRTETSRERGEARRPAALLFTEENAPILLRAGMGEPEAEPAALERVERQLRRHLEEQSAEQALNWRVPSWLQVAIAVYALALLGSTWLGYELRMEPVSQPMAPVTVHQVRSWGR